MRFMTRLFAPTAMHSQQEVAERLLREFRARSPRFRALPASH